MPTNLHCIHILSLPGCYASDPKYATFSLFELPLIYMFLKLLSSIFCCHCCHCFVGFVVVEVSAIGLFDWLSVLSIRLSNAIDWMYRDCRRHSRIICLSLFICKRNDRQTYIHKNDAFVLLAQLVGRSCECARGCTVVVTCIRFTYLVNDTVTCHDMIALSLQRQCF